MRVSGQRHARLKFSPGESTHSTHCTGIWVDPRAGLDPEALPLPGIEPRLSGRPVRSQTLYWLSYPADCEVIKALELYCGLVISKLIWSLFRTVYLQSSALVNLLLCTNFIINTGSLWRIVPDCGLMYNCSLRNLIVSVYSGYLYIEITGYLIFCIINPLKPDSSE
jgi:hypothetical protein